MSTFDRYLQGVVERGGLEAAREGSAAVEAHHLLLAIAREPHASEGEVLAAIGLEYDVIVIALDREYRASLRAAGLSVDDLRLPTATPSPVVPSRLGTSSVAALQRLAAQFRKSELGPVHLLLAIVQAQLGTVPRALQMAGFDRSALLTRLAAPASTPSAESDRDQEERCDGPGEQARRPAIIAW